MKRIIYTGLFTALFFIACKKNDLNENNVHRPKTPDYALVRFVHSYTSLTPTLATTPNGPIVDFYVNNVKITANPLSYQGIYPLVAGGGAFAEVPSGAVNIKAVLNRPTGGGLPGDTIARGDFRLGPNVSHSIILVDEFPNPTPFNPTLMAVQESVSLPPYGKFKIRLMNLIATNELYEIYNATTATVLTRAIPYKNFSDWIELPASGVSQVYQLRLVGTTTAVATTTISLTNLRSYTFWARGTNPAIPVGTGVTSRARGWSIVTTQ